MKQTERESATALYRALCAGREIVAHGEMRLLSVKDHMLKVVNGVDGLSVDYLTVVDCERLEEHETIQANSRLVGAIRLGSVRLLDNLSLDDASVELSTA